MKELHHANIILGGKEAFDFAQKIIEEDLGLKLSANPDFLRIDTESFGIEDAKEVERWARLLPFIGDVKAALITANSLGWEAQNALLKAFEEPRIGTYFFIKIENMSGILPTFLSRVRVLDKRGGEMDTGYKDAKQFLKSSIKERLSMVKVFSKNEDKAPMKDLIRLLEVVAYNDGAEPDKMKKVLKAKAFAVLRGSSPKMLLEWLACVV